MGRGGQEMEFVVKRSRRGKMEVSIYRGSDEVRLIGDVSSYNADQCRQWKALSGGLQRCCRVRNCQLRMDIAAPVNATLSGNRTLAFNQFKVTHRDGEGGPKITRESQARLRTATDGSLVGSTVF